MTKKARKTAVLKSYARVWTPFSPVEITPEMRDKYVLLRHCHSIYANSRFEVQCFACDSSIGGVMQVAIRRHGDVAEVTQEDLRRIVFELFGLETTAVEIYRPMDEVFKGRILWILPETWPIPFGVHTKASWGIKA